jgi:excinuclease ABC subunit C|tara:strand:+ start:3276 stop:5105 length:1830 start_codon:yes stop_codon:yes gene_type:complete
VSEGFDHQTFLSNLTKRPGIYRMIDDEGRVLYVGKAKHLKNRVSSYFRTTALDNKTLALVARIDSVEVTITSSEAEALLLEQNLIKELKPPYNIEFRDDKSYPFIYLSANDSYPRLGFHRGAKNRKGRYFGPYPSAGAVRDSLNILQKVFRVRQCEDTFFKNRSRPCLQYQIQRCSGPCCDLVSAEDYQEDVRLATMFLTGKNQQLLKEYANKMEVASAGLNFEKAAIYRDQMSHLRRIQEQQYVVGKQGDIDVIAAVVNPGGVCIQAMFIRGGRLLGNKTFFPKTRLQPSERDMLSAFIPQFYLPNHGQREIPRELILSEKIEDRDVLTDALQTKAGSKVRIADSVRGYRARWVNLALTNARQSLGTHLADKQNIYARFEALQEGLSLDDLPQRLECFDISHSSGEATVASCVVFDTGGPVKSDYRRFNIDGINPGDDYAAMAQALSRRYTRIKSGEGALPDVLFIDGGKGQLHEAENILEELQLSDVTIVGVAKGVSRKAGLESLFVSGRKDAVALPPDSAALHLIQQIRDESHRFAITAHRQRRARKRKESPLEGIDGIGPKRRRALLRHFGGIQQVESAAAEEIAKVEGIDQKLAKLIYATLHND